MGVEMKQHVNLISGTVGVGILLLSLVLHIVCMATPYFSELTDSAAREALTMLGYQNVTQLKNNTIGIHYGIWEFCVDVGRDSARGTFCYEFGSTSPNGTILTDSPNNSDDLIKSPDWLEKCQILSIVGLLVGAVGLISYLAWLPSRSRRMQYLFLFGSAGTCILGGLLILSGVIVFAADNSIEFYAKMNIDSFFFDPDASEQSRTLAISIYDKKFDTAWGFGLDIAAGCLCLLSAVPFTVAALQRPKKEVEIKDVIYDKSVGMFLDETRL